MCLINQVSELLPASHFLTDMGKASAEEEYVIAMTYEVAYDDATRHFKVKRMMLKALQYVMRDPGYGFVEDGALQRQIEDTKKRSHTDLAEMLAQSDGSIDATGREQRPLVAKAYDLAERVAAGGEDGVAAEKELVAASDQLRARLLIVSVDSLKVSYACMHMRCGVHQAEK